jgi:hypothetical protein
MPAGAPAGALRESFICNPSAAATTSEATHAVMSHLGR